MLIIILILILVILLYILDLGNKEGLSQGPKGNKGPKGDIGQKGETANVTLTYNMYNKIKNAIINKWEQKTGKGSDGMCAAISADKPIWSTVTNSCIVKNP